jgi:hypothetical protein
MDTLQKQINTMNGKLDGLYQLVEQLTGSLTKIATESQAVSGNSILHASVGGSVSTGRYYHSIRHTDPLMEHKDVLVDNPSDSCMQGGDKGLSPEIQIQRLTAQLTAAYNRIAALEEQLLAQRIH